MNILELAEADRFWLDEVVEVHMESFQGFFLTFLGRGFLKHLYRGFVEHPDSGLLLVTDNFKVVGFLAYSRDMSAFYKYLLNKHVITFAFYALLGFLRRPRVFFRLMRALGYSRNAKRAENYIELSSIGVHPKYSRSGIGTMLVRELKAKANHMTGDYIKLETDAENNGGVNQFYIDNGFVLHHIYETPEKRKMNEYRFYLKEQQGMDSNIRQDNRV